VEAFFHHIGHSVRMFVKNPGFTAAAVPRLLWESARTPRYFPLGWGGSALGKLRSRMADVHPAECPRPADHGAVDTRISSTDNCELPFALNNTVMASVASVSITPGF
jgi:hypothetical protein